MALEICTEQNCAFIPRFHGSVFHRQHQRVETKSPTMTDNQIPNPNPPSKSRVSGEPGHTGNYHYPNPPDATNPDAATLREQWNFAKRQYSRWYSQAWGSAILAGMAFFALGWVIKGGNPLPSSVKHEEKPNQEQKRYGYDVPSPPVPPPLTSSPRDAHEIPNREPPNSW